MTDDRTRSTMSPTTVLPSLAPDIASLLQSPEAYERLVVSGSGNVAARAQLASAQPAQLLTAPIVRPAAGEAVLSGLWLWTDWLDESHALSQSIGSNTGSFWHAIMHRREGDFSNAKYWYARCASHPAHRTIAARLPGWLAKQPFSESAVLPAAASRMANGDWNASRLVDLAEAECDSTGPAHALAVAVQRLEWHALFEHTVAEATGATA